MVVWQKGKDLAVRIYYLTASGAFLKDRGLTDQMRRSAVSIPSNIAEGDQRDTDKEAVRFFFIAKGSAAELHTQLIIAQEIGYLSAEISGLAEKECSEIMGMLAKLIAARSRSFS